MTLKNSIAIAQENTKIPNKLVNEKNQNDIEILPLLQAAVQPPNNLVIALDLPKFNIYPPLAPF